MTAPLSISVDRSLSFLAKFTRHIAKKGCEKLSKRWSGGAGVEALERGQTYRQTTVSL